MSFMQRENKLQKLPMCDLECMRDSQAAVEVAHPCLQNMFSKETQPDGPLLQQKEINQRMRATLIAWLVEVHLKFKLTPETLYITVTLIDRICDRIPIKRSELQLIGVTSMLIASKYQEVDPPLLLDFVYITDNSYTREQVLQTEHLILTELGFELSFPTAYTFLERFLQL